MFVGLDGCAKGWVAVRLDKDGTREIDFLTDLKDCLNSSFTSAMIDIPIGLPESDYRNCDLEGRKLLGENRSRLFSGARRPLLSYEKREDAHAWGKATDGIGVSCQLFCLLPKIRQVDELMTSDRQTNVRESHPELIFQRLNGKQKMSYLKVDGCSRHMLPRMNIGVAQERVLHQPDTQGQNHSAPSARRQRRIHHADPSAWPQLRQRPAKDRVMMRHCAVGEAEQHAIERLGRLVVYGVAMLQRHVPPPMPVDEATRPRQHSRRQINAIDVAGVTNRSSQGGQIAARAAADFQDPVSGPQFERCYRLLAKFSRNKQ
jgi:predicted RNase H-like nuclease